MKKQVVVTRRMVFDIDITDSLLTVESIGRMDNDMFQPGSVDEVFEYVGECIAYDKMGRYLIDQIGSVRNSLSVADHRRETPVVYTQLSDFIECNVENVA